MDNNYQYMKFLRNLRREQVKETREALKELTLELHKINKKKVSQ